MCAQMDAKEGHQLSFSIALCLNALRQDLSLN